MSPVAEPAGSGGRESATRSGRNVQSAYLAKAGAGAAAGDVAVGARPTNWNASAPGKRQRTSGSDKNDAEDGSVTPTPGPHTPAITTGGGTPPKLSRGQDGGDGEGAKKHRGAWSQEAVGLGYESGTIKNSAYVLLAASGPKGMTVAAIVDAATKQGCVTGACFM